MGRVLMNKFSDLSDKFHMDKEYRIIHMSKGFKPLCFVGEKILTFKKEYYIC